MSVVKEGWEQGVAEVLLMVDQLIRKVSGGLSSWSSNVLGAWEKQRKMLRRELELCRRGPLSSEGVAKEAITRFKLEQIEEQIDIYWKQRSHTKWLEKGDRKTKFFHAACSKRKRRNRIGRLQDGVGGWVEGEVEKRDFITNFFLQLFQSNVQGDVHRLLQSIEPCVMPIMNDDPMAEFTEEEIKVALDSIGDMKAPGPDGMPAIFYKHF